ncbi:trace amine-associated receptor 1-like [Gouania willdenowi]|uniref:trace amine-associated receptor 1-like n=1 Tax=Gouania willdenowi TaxID=441366 RepID=UPI0010566410|nr:trace amine-associated receptor 1-like [Gouania willdenowi]
MGGADDIKGLQAAAQGDLVHVLQEEIGSLLSRGAIYRSTRTVPERFLLQIMSPGTQIDDDDVIRLSHLYVREFQPRMGSALRRWRVSDFLTDDETISFCNESGSNLFDQTVFSYLSCVLIGLLSVLITCGNFLVITSIIYFKQLHTPTNYLVLSLAVADLLVGVFIMPFTTVLSVSSCWYFRRLVCKLRNVLDSFLCLCSILNLCAISVDRYYVVCQPLMYKTKITGRVAGFMVLVAWTISALLAILITVNASQEKQTNARCKLFQISKMALFGAFVGFYIPAIVIVSLYMKVLAVAQRQAVSIQSTKSGATVSKMERKATKILSVVIGIFLICWAPFVICVSSYPFIISEVPGLVLETLKWLGWSNSMLNPFIYAFFYRWFRRCFRMIVTGKIFQAGYSNSKLF